MSITIKEREIIFKNIEDFERYERKKDKAKKSRKKQYVSSSSDSETDTKSEYDTKSDVEEEPSTPLQVSLPHVIEFDELEDILREHNPEIKKASNHNNYNLLFRLYRKYLKQDEFDINLLTKPNYKNVMSAISNAHLAPTDERNILSSIKVAFRMYPNLKIPAGYEARIDELSELIEEYQSKQEMNIKEKTAMPTQDEIDKLYNKYKNSDDFDGKQRFLVLNLYTRMEPLRCDWANVLVDGWVSTDTKNYLDVNTGIFHLFNYKTAAKSGPLQIKLPEEVLKVVKNFLEWRKTVGINKKMLLLNPTDKLAMTEVSLTKYLTRIFGRNMGCNILRKYWVDKHVDTKAVADAIKTAKKMGHSVDTQNKYYSKNK